MAMMGKAWLLLAAAAAAAAGVAQGRASQGGRPSELEALYSVPAVVKSALPHTYVTVGGIREWDWCNVGGRSFCTRALNQRKKVDWAEKAAGRAARGRARLRPSFRVPDHCACLGRYPALLRLVLGPRRPELAERPHQDRAARSRHRHQPFRAMAAKLRQGRGRVLQRRAPRGRVPADPRVSARRALRHMHAVRGVQRRL